MATKNGVKPQSDLSTVEALLDKSVVTLDRRAADRRSRQSAAVDTGDSDRPQRKAQRRRHIDPTTCERDYNEAEIEFMKAMDEYKHTSGRMFPTCSEVLEVIRNLGYVQLSDEQAEALGLVDNETDAENCGLDSDAEIDELEEELV